VFSNHLPLSFGFFYGWGLIFVAFIWLMLFI
jgi:hypothetical protein